MLLSPNDPIFWDFCIDFHQNDPIFWDFCMYFHPKTPYFSHLWPHRMPKITLSPNDPLFFTFCSHRMPLTVKVGALLYPRVLYGSAPPGHFPGHFWTDFDQICLNDTPRMIIELLCECCDIWIKTDTNPVDLLFIELIKTYVNLSYQ